jgi:hypothetical protein
LFATPGLEDGTPRLISVDDSQAVCHHESHWRLVGHAKPNPAESVAPAELDAIIVPASRPAHNLDHAITLARALRCHLVILCSREAQLGEVFDLLAARSFITATVVEIPPNYEPEFLTLATTNWIKEHFPARNSDLSTKRNVGLALARSCDGLAGENVV